MTRNRRNIALALSGGGIRAAIFHLGVLGRLAKDELLDDVTFISTVSGGSLAIGLVYALSNNVWPTSTAYLESIYPHARTCLTTIDLERAIILEGITHPYLIVGHRAKLVSLALERCWGVHGKVNDIAMTPRWAINATSYESGKDWRFTPHRMGDYVLNYVENPAISLSDALAASAGYPFLIGPLVLKTSQHKWRQFLPTSTTETEPFAQPYEKIHLWDGGVYDNLGLEAIFKPYRSAGQEPFRKDVDFLIVSDASVPIEQQVPRGLFYRRARRLLAITMDQVRSLRERSVRAHFFAHPGSGIYLAIGKSGPTILSEAKQGSAMSEAPAGGFVDHDVQTAARMPTRLSRVSRNDFDCVYRHGWDVAHHTILACSPNLLGTTDLSDIPCVAES